jgi:hypothetical protein
MSTYQQFSRIAQVLQSVDLYEVLERCVEEFRNGLALVLAARVLMLSTRLNGSTVKGIVPVLDL